MFLVHIRFPLVYWNTCIKTITRTCINKIVGDSTRRCKSGLIVTVARFARWDQWLLHNASKSWLLRSSKLFGHWWVCYKYMCITFFMIAETRYVVTKNKKNTCTMYIIIRTLISIEFWWPQILSNILTNSCVFFSVAHDFPTVSSVLIAGSSGCLYRLEREAGRSAVCVICSVVAGVCSLDTGKGRTDK